MNSSVASAAAVLEFWFGSEPDDAVQAAQRESIWFGADPEFDRQVREAFSATLAAAAEGTLRRWKLSPTGTLALVLVFDQFPRNIYRDCATAFAYDLRALALCRDAIAMGSDLELGIIQRSFLYLPLEHAEDLLAQDHSVAAFTRLHEAAPQTLRERTASALHHAHAHRDLIARFGRFPHRNLVLDRPSSAAEIAWLSEHGNRYSAP